MATVDKLIIEIDGNAAQAKNGIDSMVKSLESLRSAASNQRSLNVVSAGIKSIRDSAFTLDVESISKLSMMSDALAKMGVLDKIKLSTSWASQIKGIGDATRSLQGVDWSPLAELADKLSPLGNIQKANNLNNVVNTLRKMPDAMKAVADIDSTQLQKFADSVEQIRKAIQPLADEMRAVKEGFSSLPANIRKAIKENEKLTQSAEKSKKTFGDYLKRILKFSALAYGFGKIKDAAMDAFEASNDYIEALNLADVAMGSGAQKAVEYAQKVEAVAGINMTEWLSELSTFNQQLQAFGIPDKTANNMSQQLTQLGYDMQSAFNIKDIDTVMKRIQSGISGEVEGMRRYGVELSTAAMQEYALSKGITAKWSSMTTAQKVALRYNKIMEQTSNIQGDLARTIITPANSLRIFYSQCAIATRYIGQIVSVIAAKLIPIFQAVVVVIGRAAQAIASFFGFSLPSIGGMETDLKGAVGGASDLEQALGGAGSAAKDAAKEVKGLLAGWDEINIIQQESDKAGSGGGGGGAGGGALGDLWGLGDYSYDFLKGIKDQVNDIIEKIEHFKPWILGLLSAIAGFGIGRKISDIAKKLGLSKIAVSAIKDITAAIGLSISGIIIGWSGIDGIINGEGFTPENIVKTAYNAIVQTWAGYLVARGFGFETTMGKMACFKFGLGLSLAITSAMVSFSLAKKMATEGVTLTSVLEAAGAAIIAGFGIGSSAVSLGATMPLAITLGSVAAIVVGIGSIVVYSSKKAEQLAAEAEAALSEGDFTVDDVISAVQAEFSARNAEAKILLEPYVELKNQEENLESARTAVKNLNDEVFGTEKPNVEKINELKTAWNDFNTALSSTRDAAFDTMFSGLNVAIEKEYAYLKNSAVQYKEQLLIIQQGMSERQAKRQTEANSILDGIIAGTATQEDIQRYFKLTSYVEKTAGQLKFEEMIANPFSVALDSEDPVGDAKRYVQEIHIAASEVYETYKEAYEGWKYSVLSAKDELSQELSHGEIDQTYYNGQIKVLDGLLQQYEETYKATVKDTQSDVETMYQSLLNSILSPEALNKLVPKNWYDALGADKAVRQYVDDMIAPMISEMETAGDVSSDFIDKVKLIQQVMKGANATTDGLLYGPASYGIQLQDVIQAALGGWFTLEDLTNSSLGTNMDEFSKLISTFKATLTDESLTIPAVDTTTNFDPSLEETKTYVKTTWNADMTEATKITAASPDMKNVTNALNSTLTMGRQWNTAMTGLLNIGGTRTTLNPAIMTPKIGGTFAEGGFPSEGSLFIANEQGPELVGQIGNQSAVANNGQIVDGIARGVANANREQNSYYQRMIALLEQLNRKENSVVVKPSPELGKTVSRSVKMYESVRGY